MNWLKRAGEVGSSEHAMLADFAAAGVGHPVKAQAVRRKVDFLQRAALELLHLSERHMALEYGLLHTLAGSFAHPGNLPEAPTALPGFGVDVVTDDNEHDGHRIEKGR